jgi:hypothetical protein
MRSSPSAWRFRTGALGGRGARETCPGSKACTSFDAASAGGNAKRALATYADAVRPARQRRPEVPEDDDLGAQTPFGERTLALVRGYKRDLDRNRVAMRAVRQELARRGCTASEVRILDLIIWSVEAGNREPLLFEIGSCPAQTCSCRAWVDGGAAADLLQRLAHVYIGPEVTFPPRRTCFRYALPATGRDGRRPLRLEPGPRVLEAECAVEDEPPRRRVGIRAEIAQALELHGLTNR